MRISDRVFSRAGLITAWILLVLLPLPVRELMNPDESRFAHQAQSMKESGDWVVPYIGDNKNVDKPPVLFWSIVAVSSPLDRVTETTSRVPSAIGALVVCLLAARLARRLWGSETIAWGAALITLTGVEFLQKSQWCSCDMPMAAFAWTAITLWGEALYGDPPPIRPRLGIVLGWTAAGIGILTKGPVALLWAVFWIVAEAIARRRFRPLVRLLWNPGILVAVAIVGGWLYLLGERAGWDFVYEATITQNLERYATAWNSVKAWWFYLYQVPLDLLPWTGFLPAALLVALRGWKASKDGRGAIAARAASLFVLFGVLFFSGSSGKRGVYMMEAFPALAMLVAAAILGGGASRLGFALMALVGFLAGVAAPIAIASGVVDIPAELSAAAGPIGGIALVAAGLAMLSGSVVGFVHARRGHGEAAMASALTGTGFAMLMAVTIGCATWSRMQSAQPFGARIDAAIPKEARLAIERGKFEQILFYSRRRGSEFQEDAQFARELESGLCGYGVMTRSRYEALRDRSPADRLVVLVEGRINQNDYVLIGPPGS